MNRILLICISLMAFISFEGFSQDRTITGSVSSDEDNSALPGVTVAAKGNTTIGTVTDSDGKYSITVPADVTTLIYSYIGMNTQEISIGGKTVIDIRMTSDVKQLSEVVVTALGIQREEKALGYSVTKVGGDNLADVNQTNVVNSLSGRVAGVQVTGASGNMGGSSRITIRGINSITGNNSPLFVVDGVVMNNSDYNTRNTQRGAGGYDYGNMAQDINPEDIESVSVLKGPNATALYGSRGGNGVIVITTKKGTKRKGIGVRVSSNVSFDKVYVLPDYQREYGGGFEVPDEDGGQEGFAVANIDGTDYKIADYATDESWGPRYTSQQVLHWNSFDQWDTENYLKPREWKAPDNDVRDFFNTGATWTNSVELSGGNDNSVFRLSYTNMDLSGYMPNSSLKRNSVNFSGSTKLAKLVDVFTTFNYVRNDAKGRPSTGYDDNNIMQKFNQWGQRQLDMEELKAYKNPDGSQRTWNRSAYDDATPMFSDNPYWTRYENYQSDIRNRFFGNIGAAINITPWLKLQGKLNSDYYNLREMERVAIGSQALSKYQEALREFNENNLEFLLIANKNISEALSFSGTFGVNRMDQYYRSNLGLTNGGLILPNFYNLTNSTSPASTIDFDRHKRINSVLGSATLGFRNMIFLELTARNDWSSSLPSNNNSYFYPSVSGSFVLTELDALKNNDILSFAKIRAGWAMVGNDTDAYNVNLVYSSDIDDVNFFPYNFGGLPLYGVGGPNAQGQTNVLNNPNLKPETTKAYEFGGDFRFFQNRLGVDVTYYNKSTTDQIIPLQVSGATGVSFVTINAGEMRNRGVEIMLTGQPIKINNGLTWDVSVNWARNRNEIVSLLENEGVNSLSLTNAPFSVTLNAMVGESYGSIRGTDFVYDQDGNKVVGSNGRYLASPITTIGNILPDWTAGITNTFSFKGIDFSALIDIREGGEFFSTTYMWGTYSGILDHTAENGIRENGLVVPAKVAAYDESNQIIRNENGTVQTAGDNTTNISALRWAADHYSGPAKQNVFDASYIKLREVRLGYTLPASFTGPLKNVKVSAFGRNLAILKSSLEDVDPENTTSSGNIQGIEGGALPSLRTYGFSVSFGL